MKLLLFLVFLPLFSSSMHPSYIPEEYFCINFSCQDKIDHMRCAAIIRTTHNCHLNGIVVTYQSHIQQPERLVETFINTDNLHHSTGLTFFIPKE